VNDVMDQVEHEAEVIRCLFAAADSENNASLARVLRANAETRRARMEEEQVETATARAAQSDAGIPPAASVPAAAMVAAPAPILASETADGAAAATLPDQAAHGKMCKSSRSDHALPRDLPSEMLVSILQHVDSATSVLSMYEICTTWRGALIAEEKNIDAIWCTLAVKRFPIAAKILQHVSQPASGVQFYRSQLKHEKARRPPHTLDTPRTTTLNGYLFNVEWEFITFNEVSRDFTIHHKGHWAGFLQEYSIAEQEFAELPRTVRNHAGRICRLHVPLEIAQPDWVDAAYDLDARVRVRISLTNLASLETILLDSCAGLAFDADAEWPTTLSVPRDRQLLPEPLEIYPQLPSIRGKKYTDSTAMLSWDRGQIPGRGLELNCLHRFESDDDFTHVPMERHEILHYLERVAPW